MNHVCDAFQVFDEWIAKVQAKNIQIMGRIFAVDVVRQQPAVAGGQQPKPVFRLRVNFSTDVITIAKEVVGTVVSLSVSRPTVETLDSGQRRVLDKLCRVSRRERLEDVIYRSL